MDVSRHADYHFIFGHLPPDFIARKIGIYSADWENSAGSRLPAGFYEDVLQELHAKHWKEFYYPEAFKPNSKELSEYYSLASQHIYNHLKMEQFAVSDAIHALTTNTYLSPKAHMFRYDVKTFFHQNSPSQALREFLKEKKVGGEFMWSKPMLPDVRSRLLTITKEVALEPMRETQRQRICDALHVHKEILQTYTESWTLPFDSESKQIKTQLAG